MDYIGNYSKIHFAPKANPDSIVSGSNVRFTVLTDRFIRMEYSPIEQFEDRPSQVFWHRDQPVPQYNVVRSEDKIEIITQYLHLKYSIQEDDFNCNSLSILMKDTGYTWHYGDADVGNLMGTARTLDRTGGWVQLEKGLISKDGWTVIDDSKTLIFGDNNCWIQPRGQSIDSSLMEMTKDLYFLGYGREYKRCIQDFCKLAGGVPLIPRWALGNWWSRYWPYTQDELTTLMAEFEKKEIPLSVCIIDMDWHIVKNEYSSGWTGFTWNSELFPKHEEFIGWLHGKGLKTALNLHPVDGIYPHEKDHAEFAEYMGMEIQKKEHIPFDVTDPKFMEGYFNIIIHKLENEGIDFWWMDWQQGTECKIQGLDPLIWLNHLHFYDLGRDNRRSFVFSRWGGLGNHRYPIGFSGDTYVTWEALAFQPYFTATAANVCFGWWSHDIGGHFLGKEDYELYTRWVQFGVFSPILRLHCANDIFIDRRPWSYEEVFPVVKDAMRIRHSLIPYIYSMAWVNFTESLPLITPMYYNHPLDEKAYNCPNQYYFGSELLVSPYVSPRDKATNLSKQKVWLPEGEWFNFFSGEYYQGNKTYTIYGELTDIPVFAKAGAIIPMDSKTEFGRITNPSNVDVIVFPGLDNCFELYEDDGETMDYVEGKFCLTKFVQKWYGDSIEFIIKGAEGNTSVIPAKRIYRVIFKGIKEPEQACLFINGSKIETEYKYDAKNETFIIEQISLNPSDTVLVRLSIHAGCIMLTTDRAKVNLMKALKSFDMETELKNLIFKDFPAVVIDPNILKNYIDKLEINQFKFLLELSNK